MRERKEKKAQTRTERRELIERAYDVMRKRIAVALKQLESAWRQWLNVSHRYQLYTIPTVSLKYEHTRQYSERVVRHDEFVIVTCSNPCVSYDPKEREQFLKETLTSRRRDGIGVCIILHPDNSVSYILLKGGGRNLTAPASSVAEAVASTCDPSCVAAFLTLIDKCIEQLRQLEDEVESTICMWLAENAQLIDEWEAEVAVEQL